MRIVHNLLFGANILASLGVASRLSAQTDAVFSATVRPILSKHCFPCHNEKLKTGKLSLEGYRDGAQAAEHREVWDKELEIGIPESHHGLVAPPARCGKAGKASEDPPLSHGAVRLLSGQTQIDFGWRRLTLDNSMIVYGSGLADGDRHGHNNLPALLAGRGCGAIQPGHHIRCSRDTPMANLFTAMLHKMQVPAGSFGDSEGKLGVLTNL